MKKMWAKFKRWMDNIKVGKKYRIVILMRRDREYNWQKANPVLRYGELAASIHNDGKVKYKIGDGVTPYKNLPFWSNEVVRSVDVYNSDVRIPVDKVTVYFKKRR